MSKLYFLISCCLMLSLNSIGQQNRLEFDGSQILADGTDLFWITYDINSNYNNGNNLDALKLSLTEPSGFRIPLKVSSSGRQLVFSCSSPSPGWRTAHLHGWCMQNLSTILYLGSQQTLCDFIAYDSFKLDFLLINHN